MTLNHETARRIADEHCAAWASCRPDDVAARYAETTSFGMNGGVPMTTRPEIAAMASGLMADFPNLVLTCDSVMVAGSHMIYAWTFEGRHKETGNPVRLILSRQHRPTG